MADLTFTQVNADDESARWVMTEFFDELDRRFEGGYDGETALAEAHLTLSAPHGLFVLVELKGSCVGGGGIYWIDDERAEIKRVWLAPSVRGRGISKALMTHLEQLALGGAARGGSRHQWSPHRGRHHVRPIGLSGDPAIQRQPICHPLVQQRSGAVSYRPRMGLKRCEPYVT